MTKNIVIHLLLLTTATNILLPMQQNSNSANNNNNPINVRTFLATQSCNQKNTDGHTFFYQLALECARYNEWRPMGNSIEQYLKRYKDYTPNPFIEHERIVNNEVKYLTAKQEAKKQFKASGNPTCKVLMEFLDEAEIMFVDRSSSKQSREHMAAQK